MAKPKKVCTEPKDCRVVAARLDFKAAKGCAARKEAAEAFRQAVAKRIVAAPKALKESLYKEALRHVAGAYRSCGDEASAQRAEAFERSEAARFNGLSGVRRRRRSRR